MSSETKVTRSKGGSKERIEPVGQITIPDLWHIASTLRNDKRIEAGSKHADQILECWGIAHDLRSYIIEQP